MRCVLDARRSLREEEILELQTRLFLRDVAGKEVPLDAHSEVMPQTKGFTAGGLVQACSLKLEPFEGQHVLLFNVPARVFFSLARVFFSRETRDLSVPLLGARKAARLLPAASLVQLATCRRQVPVHGLPAWLETCSPSGFLIIFV